MPIPLNPQETILFEGVVTLIKSKFSNMQTEAVITNQRLLVKEGKLRADKADIASVAEEKHGFAPKLVIRLRNGESVSLQAPNQPQLQAAAMILMGQSSVDSLPGAPSLKQVKNKTAWLAATGPVWAGFIALIVGTLLFGNPERWRTAQELSLFAFRIGLIYFFLRLDFLFLTQQGYHPKELGVKDPNTFPLYLFSRAKAFGHSKAYAITWCVLVGIDILLLLV